MEEQLTKHFGRCQRSCHGAGEQVAVMNRCHNVWIGGGALARNLFRNGDKISPEKKRDALSGVYDMYICTSIADLMRMVIEVIREM